MRRELKHVVSVIAVAVALMSGILSLVREFLLFQYPTKFQEPPLFWGCLRIAFGCSLIILWYGERKNRLIAEKAITAQPKENLRKTILNLSGEILAFIYDRSQSAPKLPGYTPIFFGGDPAEMMRRMDETNAAQNAHHTFERDTIGIYDYKFRRRAKRAVDQLRENGSPVDSLSGLILSPLSSSEVKTIGMQLGQLAESLPEHESIVPII